MRDLALAIAVAYIFVSSFRNSYIGFLGWTWFSMMNPHKLVFGWMYNRPVAQVLFMGLIIGLVFDRNRSRLVQHGITVLQILFVVWMAITSVFAIFPDSSMEQLEKVIKIQLGIFISYMVVNSKERMNLLMWVLYLSVGFYGIKGGIFTIRSGGSQKVWGPEGSFIGDNNSLACALLMIMPIGVYLISITNNVIVKRGLIASVGLIGISVLGSASRGALLGLLAVCLFWLRKVPGKQKIMALLIFIVFGVAMMAMPGAWWDRMNTVKSYDKDASAMGRINAWWCAFNLAKDRFTGGGFEYYSSTVFALYAPDPNDVHAAHSIYFQVLGDHGFVGLGLFLMIALWSWVLLGKIIRKTQGNHDLLWANLLARIIQLSFIAYYAAGTFLSLAYYDLYWQLVAVTVTLNTITTRANTEQQSKNMSEEKSSKRPVTFVRTK